MEKHSLKTEKRDAFGRGLAVFRAKGHLPAVLYGPKDPSRSFFVDFGDFKRVWKKAGETGVIELDFEGKKKQVLIYDVDVDPLKGEPRHVDFYAVDMAKKTTVSVPLVFEGEAPAVKVLGGVLVKVIHELEVEALPADLPSELKVDISKLATFEDRVEVSDIKVPQGAEILTEPDEVVALVEEPREEEVTEEPASIADIEVTSKKKDEDGEEKEEGEGKKEE